ncbi:MAG: hypothetical protein WCV92_04435 [Candidatus Buchananbacteria bacterium]
MGGTSRTIGNAVRREDDWEQYDNWEIREAEANKREVEEPIKFAAASLFSGESISGQRVVRWLREIYVGIQRHPLPLDHIEALVREEHAISLGVRVSDLHNVVPFRRSQMNQPTTSWANVQFLLLLLQLGLSGEKHQLIEFLKGLRQLRRAIRREG